MDELMGIIKLFAGNFVPQGWALCDGQLLPIGPNQALFSILGTTYGGDGKTTFGLPDLCGRVPVGSGKSKSAVPGPTTYTPGQRAGAESATLTAAQVPAHTHVLNVSNASATMSIPTSGASLAVMGQKTGLSFTPGLGYNSTIPNTSLHPSSIGNASATPTPLDVRQPLLGLAYIICLQGIYPSRS